MHSIICNQNDTLHKIYNTEKNYWQKLQIKQYINLQ